MEKRFFDAVATLVGTTIGAGILGIPFVVAKAGALLGVSYIIMIGAAIIVLNLYLGEVVLRTHGKHQLTGYAGHYLGKYGKALMAAAMCLMNYGALTAYIIGVGLALASIFSITSTAGSMVFFAVAAAIVYFGLKAVEDSELLMTSIVILVVSLITVYSLLSGRFQPENLAFIDLSKAMLPYGVVLFAFIGALAVPEMNEELGRKKKLLKKAIIFAGAIPLIIYAMFALAVVGITGADTSQVATVKLGEVLGENVLLAANLFAVLAMTTSFLAIALAMKEMYNYDYGIKKEVSWLLACFIPLVAFLAGIKEFIIVLGVTGALAGGLEGILIVLMHSRAKKLGNRKPEFTINGNRALSALLILMFAAGIVYGLIS